MCVAVDYAYADWLGDMQNVVSLYNGNQLRLMVCYVE